MPIVTLLSDIGTTDHYVATVKGYLYSVFPQVTIVDVSHNISRDNIMQGAFLLKNTFPHFPDGTIHLISVCAPMSFEFPYVAYKVNNQYFIGTDNGLFSLAFENFEVQGVVSLDSILNPGNMQSTFQLRDIFAPAALHLLKGKALTDLGQPRLNPTVQLNFAPGITGNTLTGNVIYNDHFGNAITNFSKDFLLKNINGRNFVIEMRSRTYNISKFSMAYNSVSPGDIVALFNSSSYLEIAMNQGSVLDMLGLKAGDVVKILIDND